MGWESEGTRGYIHSYIMSPQADMPSACISPGLEVSHISCCTQEGSLHRTWMAGLGDHCSHLKVSAIVCRLLSLSHSFSSHAKCISPTSKAPYHFMPLNHFTKFQNFYHVNQAQMCLRFPPCGSSQPANMRDKLSMTNVPSMQWGNRQGVPTLDFSV